MGKVADKINAICIKYHMLNGMPIEMKLYPKECTFGFSKRVLSDARNSLVNFCPLI